MSNAKEIAEYILKDGIITTNAEDVYSIARAYLELEKKLSLEQQDRESEKREFKVFKYAAENEITKLKKSREVLRTALEFYSAHELRFAKYGMSISESLVKEFYSNGSNARKALMMDDEIMKG